MAITHVALDDSKRVIVAGILRADASEPDVREIPNDPHQIRRLFERLLRGRRLDDAGVFQGVLDTRCMGPRDANWR
jgi:hypothetical protein